MKIALIVESFSEPWNEGYKNIAKYTYELLKDNPTLDISVISANKVYSTNFEDFDLIHVFNFKPKIGFFLKYSGKVKLVKHFAKNDIRHSHEKIKFRLQSFLFWDAFTTTTLELKKDLSYLGSRKIFNLIPPIPAAYFKPASRTECLLSLNLDELQSQKIIIYTGRINKQRKADWIYDCFSKKNVDTRYILAISEGIDNNLQKLENVIVLPKVLDIRWLYSIADLLIYPVERDGAVEPPLTVLEAMSCGCTVAAYKNAGISQIITSGVNGFLFSTLEELNQIVKDIASNKFELNLIKNNARNTIVKNFDLNDLQNTYFSFYENLLNNSINQVVGQ